MSTIFQLFIIILVALQTWCIQFQFSLEKKVLRCFGDNLGTNVLVVGTITADNPSYSFKIHVPSRKNDNIFHYTNSQEITKFSFTTNSSSENFQYCVHNLAQNKIHFTFEYQTGAEAMDYTLIAQQNDLQPIQLQIKKLENTIGSIQVQTFHQQIKNDQKSIDEKQGLRFEFVQILSYKIIIFSGLTLLLMVFVNIFQMQKLKRFFKSRKLI